MTSNFSNIFHSFGESLDFPQIIQTETSVLHRKCCSRVLMPILIYSSSSETKARLYKVYLFINIGAFQDQVTESTASVFRSSSNTTHQLE